MIVQQALIVDDSKTARVSLRKMLDKRQISSAMVECAEDALEYLRENQPSMIFMDHMMPGMDGFDAVKVIKADPEKSSIPIVMYTTQQGDIYVGQARALGAADILSKPASDQALTEVLTRIDKIIASESAKPEPAVHEVHNVEQEQVPPVARPVPLVPESTPTLLEELQGPSFFSLSLRQLVILLLWIIPIIWLLVMYLPADKLRKQLLTERNALYKSIEWAVNRSESYDYGEEPMAGHRLETLRGLVSHLAVSGFQGTIQIAGHVGEFCVTEVTLKKGGRVNILPSADLPLSECATIGAASAEKAMELSGRQSESFKQFLETSPLLESSGISVEIVPYGVSVPKHEYPQILEGTTVGDWNSAALRNNRVNFVLIPKE
ncbi:MAG: response regulator [Spongiibacteraceae bacterium]|nr:response regulator [Spongiibacteraceae bacterium]